jgi:hypothetical protein
MNRLFFIGPFFLNNEKLLFPWYQTQHVSKWLQGMEKKLDGWMVEWLNGWMVKWLNGWMVVEWLNG